MLSRNEALKITSERIFDVCVIGGGATGAGSALDAQLRGLHTVLLDAGDFGSGASTAATKIIHGGVRYLEEAVKSLDVKQYEVVNRALHERIRMLHNAPFLAHPLEFLIPCKNWFDVIYMGFGMKLYEWIAGKASLFASRSLEAGYAAAHARTCRPPVDRQHRLRRRTIRRRPLQLCAGQ
jgi:glycerol-3-phosphate dehydrogenase